MKTEHIQKQLDFFVRDKSHHAYRKPAEDPHALAAQFAAQGLDDMQRSVGRLRYVLAQETPVVFPDERITLLRTVRTIPEIRHMEIHRSCKPGNPYDACLIADFDDLDALSRYKNDPRHVAVSTLCKSIRESRGAIDYEL